MLAGIFATLGTCLGLVKIINSGFGATGSLDPGSALHMAAPTAVGVSSVGIFVIAWVIRELKSTPNESYRVTPTYITLGVFLAVLTLWQLFLNLEMENLKKIIDK